MSASKSLKLTIDSCIDSCIDTFINNISLKYGVDKTELFTLWNGTTISTKRMSKPSVHVTEDPSIPFESLSVSDKTTDKTTGKLIGSNAELLKLSKNELVEHCKRRNIKVTGTKNDLIERLTGTKQDTETPKVVSKPASKITSVQKKVNESAQAEVVKGLFQVKSIAYKIVKNEHGNFWHSETQLVYDRDLKKFYGKQNSNGRIINMTEEDVETCNKYKFPFVMPENMINTDKVTVTELDEDDLIGDDEDEVGDDEEIVDEEPLVDEE